jgi:hypothetical protein
MYVERSGRPTGRDPWSFRQTGVFHRFTGAQNGNFFILLHPKSKPMAQKRLELWASSPQRHSLAQHPMNVHLIVLSSYMTYWPEQIESLAGALADAVGRRLLIG